MGVVRTEVPELLGLLAAAPVFRTLSTEERREVLGRGLRRHLARGEVEAVAGEAWPYLVLVVRGTLTAAKVSPEGRALTGLELRAGDVFAAPSFFDDGPLPASLQARDEAVAYRWHRNALMPALRGNPEAMWDLAVLVVSQMRRAGEVVEQLAFQPLSGRLARLLLDRFGHARGAPGARLLTLDEMAALIGSTREVVCRLLYRLAEEGLIRISRTELSIVDPAGLADLAGVQIDHSQ